MANSAFFKQQRLLAASGETTSQGNLIGSHVKTTVHMSNHFLVTCQTEPFLPRFFSVLLECQCAACACRCCAAAAAVLDASGASAAASAADAEAAACCCCCCSLHNTPKKITYTSLPFDEILHPHAARTPPLSPRPTPPTHSITHQRRLSSPSPWPPLSAAQQSSFHLLTNCAASSARTSTTPLTHTAFRH